jgi:hypothetical protein
MRCSHRIAIGAFAVIAAGSVQAQSAPNPGAQISVGRNVQVTKQFAQHAHHDTWAAHTPGQAGRHLVCSLVQHEDHAARSVHCYTSFDDGKSWSPTLELDANMAPHIGAPSVEWGRGDTAFLATTVAPFRRGETHISSTDDVPFPTLNEWGVDGKKRTNGIFRSVNGGRSWDSVASFTYVDGPTISIDRTSGRYAGRVYVGGHLAVSGYSDGPSSIWLYRSLDGGKTFLGPVQRIPQNGGSFSGQSNTVVFADGTIAFLTTHRKATVESGGANAQPQVGGGPAATTEIVMLTSSDGGESLDPELRVSDFNGARGAGSKHLAIDPGSTLFKDRLYVVWSDATLGRSNILVSFSSDRGRTWSAPVIVNDDRPPADPNAGPDHGPATIGVNKDGVVLVAWYDRRESQDRTGWRIWASASFDGGTTFTPNVPVSEVANVYTDSTEWITGGPNVSGGGTRKPGSDEYGRPILVVRKGRPISVALDLASFFATAGGNFAMSVGADGVFHPTWVDNRTGLYQMWTSAVTVRGSVEKHGARELADLEDVTDKLTLEAESTDYDRRTHTLTFVARLKNTSKDVVSAPVKVRVISLHSQLGIPSIVGAQNGLSAVGAIWDFSGVIPPGGLRPEAISAPRTLTFRLSDVRPIKLLREPPGFTSRLIDFDARVYSGAKRERASP